MACLSTVLKIIDECLSGDSWRCLQLSATDWRLGSFAHHPAMIRSEWIPGRGYPLKMANADFALGESLYLQKGGGWRGGSRI